MGIIPFRWTDNAVKELKHLWCEQGASAAVTAQLLSEKFGRYLTRNAVIGKVNRLHLEKPKGAKYADKIGRPKNKDCPVVKHSLTSKAPVIRAPVLRAEPVALEAPDQAKRISIIDLRETTCRFPIGDPRTDDFGYCGAPSPIGGSPYCEFHHRIVYVPPQQQAKRRNGDHHGMRVVQLASH